jgi:hypothetical protein
MVRRWDADPRTARDWLRCTSREDLAEILQGLEKGLAPGDRTPTTAAIAAEAREVLRTRKLEKKPRDFVRFFYGNRIAGDLDLPALLREPEVYRLHPDPEVAAAIMVVHRFAPQISAELFNYKDWAMKPGPMPPGDPATCPCHAQALPQAVKVDGHVMSTEADHLAAGYLRDILRKGKKYRLQQPIPTVLRRLEEGLAEYVEYKKKKDPDPGTHEALDRWAKAVRARAKARLTDAARDRPPDPDGYPGLREQMRVAKNALVFGPEDRAPHGFFLRVREVVRGQTQRTPGANGGLRGRGKHEGSHPRGPTLLQRGVGFEAPRATPVPLWGLEGEEASLPVDRRHLAGARRRATARGGP